MGVEEDLAAATAKVKTLDDEVDKWKAMSRKHEDRAKENAAAADELTKLKQSTLSDQQKLDGERKAQADQLAELKKRADEADSRALRAEVASAKGLSAAQAKRLTGSTQEELEADADDLLETFKPSTDGDKPKTPSKPTESLKGGGDPTTEENATDIRKMVADIPRGF